MNKTQQLNRTNRVYTTPFIIESKKVVTDEKTRIQKEEWKQKYRLYGQFKALHGRDYELARQMGSEKTIKFIIPFGPKIDETMRIKFQGKIYDIENIDNIGMLNEEVEIRAKEKRFKK